jgi:RNA polymerase sigma factor (sigma-70 family)
MDRNKKKTRGSPLKNDLALSHEQRILVENHLQVVRRVIAESIHTNETIYGFGYEDIFQEGCIWLCQAAASYNRGIASFATYARKVVRNGLISYCRTMCGHQKHFQYLEVGENGELMADGEALSGQADRFTEYINEKELLELLESCKGEYEGVAKLGIEAIKWKIRGMEIKDIAAMYRVPPNHVGAWISRSAGKLRNNGKFLQGIQS